MNSSHATSITMVEGNTAFAVAEAAERAVFAEIGALGERELTAVKLWIASGCEGEQPKPDKEARRVLADRLSKAIAAREAAEKPAGGRPLAPARNAGRIRIAATASFCGDATRSD